MPLLLQRGDPLFDVDEKTRRRAAATHPFAFIPKPLDEYDLHALMDRLSGAPAF